MAIVGDSNVYPCPDCNSKNTYHEYDTKSYELFLDCQECGTHMHLIRKLTNTAHYTNPPWEEEE